MKLATLFYVFLFSISAINAQSPPSIHLGGEGVSEDHSCPDGQPVETTAFNGGEGVSEGHSCPEGQPVETMAYNGGTDSDNGIDFNEGSSCKFISPFILEHTLGGEGENATTACDDFAHLEQFSYAGGEGENAATACDDFAHLDKIYWGGYDSIKHSSCAEDFFFASNMLGGGGVSMFSTCDNVDPDIAYLGGGGWANATTCPDDYLAIVSRGGLGEFWATTCPADYLSIVSRGGPGVGGDVLCKLLTSLYITKTASDLVSCVGKPNQFKIKVEFPSYLVSSLNTITNIQVRDSLGAGLTYHSSTAPAGSSYNSTSGVWSIPSISKGQSYTLTLNATGSGLGNLNNTSWIKTADQDAFIRDKAIATVEVRDGVEVRPDIRVQLSASPNRLINLSKYLDTAFVSATWTDLNNTIATGSGVVQSNQFTPGRTYSFKVNIQDYCNPTTIKAYIQALKPVTPVQYTRTVVICHTQAKDLHLNRMLGINANGIWHTPTTGASSYLLVSSLPAHAGARIFDGASAYSEVNLIPTITHNTDATARKVVFTYTINDAASVLHGKTFTLNIILTKDML